MWFGDFMSSESLEYWSRIAEDIVEMTSMPEPKKIKREEQAKKPSRIANHKSQEVISVQYQRQ